MDKRDLANSFGQPHRFVGNYKSHDINEFAEWSWGSFELDRDNRPESVYYIPEYLSGSDYSGGSVTISNYNVFKEEFADQQGAAWWDLYGGYGTYGIAIDVTKMTDEMRETIEALDNYPVISEDDMSMREHEVEQEAWNNHIESDFRNALLKEFTEGLEDEEFTEVEERIENLSSEDLYTIFHNAMESTNTYYEHETGGSVYVDIERVVEGVSSLEVPDPNQQELPLD